MNAYNSIDKTIHQLVQTIAKFNRSFVPSKEDDSHTNLAFDALGERILGRWAESSKGLVIMSLHLTKFQFELRNLNQKVLFVFTLGGKKQEEIEKEIQAALVGLNLDSSEFIKPLHFEIHSYDFVDDVYVKWSKADINQWMKLRSKANEACAVLLNYLQLDGEVRIWPHHFDTGIYVEATKELGVGFGLAMKDGILNAPYYYYSGYALNDAKLNYSSFESLESGKWIIKDNWKGAVLSLEHASENRLSEFLKEVSEWYYSILK